SESGGPTVNLTVMLRYQALLAALALTLFALAVPYGIGDPLTVGALALVAAVAERGRVRLNDVTSVSITMMPIVFAAAVFGPLAALIGSVLSVAWSIPPALLRRDSSERGRSRSPLLRSGVYSCICAIYGASAGFAATAVKGTMTDKTTGLIVATVTAS